MFKYELGVELKDRLTGYQGIVVGRTEYLNGCHRYSLQSRQLNKDNKPAEWEAFDEMQLDPVGGVEVIGQQKTGGPQPAPRDVRRDAQRQ